MLSMGIGTYMGLYRLYTKPMFRLPLASPPKGTVLPGTNSAQCEKLLFPAPTAENKISSYANEKNNIYHYEVTFHLYCRST